MPADETPRSALSETSPAASVAAADHGVRAAMPLDLLPYGRNLIGFGTAADSPRLPHARYLPPHFSCSRMHVAIMLRDLALPNNPPGRVHTADGRAAYREMCRHVSFRFRLPPHLLSPRIVAAAAVVAGAAAVMECTRQRCAS